MLPIELINQIRLLEIRTNRIVEEFAGGVYRSVFKGQGIEFDEVREYTEDDDVRTIDWNVSARMGAPYVKKFVEERELNVMLLVDVSASGAFGSSEKSKRRTATELAALLAFSAGYNGDKVGLMMFSDQVELYVPPKSGRSHTLRLIQEMLTFKPAHSGTNIDSVLCMCAKILKKRTVVFLLSDLIEPEKFAYSLKMLNERHDVIALELYDPVERAWPIISPVAIEDAETGELIVLHKNYKTLLNDELENSEEKKRCVCHQARVDLVEIEVGFEVIKPVIEFFSRRKMRLRR